MDNFVEDLKASVEQARRAPEGKGDTMSLYGTSYNQCICLRIDYVTGLGSSSRVHQDQLTAAFRALEDMQMLEPLRERWDELMQRICQELDRVTRLKMMEWNRQVCGLRSSKDNSVCSRLQAVQVDTGGILSSFLSDD